MLRGSRLPLWPWVLLLLPPPPLAGALEPRGRARPEEAAEEPGSGRARPAFQDLQEQLRAAIALTRRYWALFTCRVWPETCGQDGKSPLAWSLPLLGQQYLDILTTWYCSFQDCCPSGDCRISNNLTGAAAGPGEGDAGALPPDPVRV
ncbi:torsin family 3 member A [Phyllostomus discolor]|uniref:Torsin family 3 member A n=1 Tax=Phyllostomus discolor TaxID=89673 RepID=A0A833YNH6_9CHIR|nr:torsin family 3 member A [Phyllostomus discolor]